MVSVGTKGFVVVVVVVVVVSVQAHEAYDCIVVTVYS